jgi:hypothetical protein
MATLATKWHSDYMLPRTPRGAAKPVARHTGKRDRATIIVDEYKTRSGKPVCVVRVKFGISKMFPVKPATSATYASVASAKQAGTAFAKKGKPMLSKSRKRAETIRRAYARIPR